jgi:hypothetical protein
MGTKFVNFVVVVGLLVRNSSKPPIVVLTVVQLFCSYGVSRLYAVFALGVWTSNKTVYKSNIEIDSGDIANLMFHTPLDRSFLCADVGNLVIVNTNIYHYS